MKKIEDMNKVENQKSYTNIPHKQYINRFDFMFTFNVVPKRSKYEKIWNWSPFLFILHLLVFQYVVSSIVPEAKILNNDRQSIMQLDNEYKSIKNTKFISDG